MDYAHDPIPGVIPQIEKTADVPVQKLAIILREIASVLGL